MEKENYNWSCRIHKSTWGGEMWWCCGKTVKEAPGCLVTKHEAGEMDDDYNAKGLDKDGKKNLATTRCVCCRGIGHDISQCPRDPNFKTKEDC